ncbi:MAG: BamA/TamA family outer membrane protein [Bacteroidales bacterium]|nr:BamA/TamA family outer membrane protein [Bacteroidales bacterium]
MKRRLAFIIIIATLAAASCSTTRILQEDQCRLAENKIIIGNDDDYPVSSLLPYIKQKPNDYFIGRWNPFLYVYNWSSGRGTGWDRFVEKLGVAPVVFDSTAVDASKKGMLSHLEYSGYYDSEISHSILKKKKNVTVKYDVTLGKRYVIDSISYEVPDPYMRELLAADSANYTVNVGDILSEKDLEDESERLASLYRRHGYYGFTKNYFFFYADTVRQKDRADLTVALENYTRNESEASARPHKQYTIGSVSIVPMAGLKVRDKFLWQINTIKPGELYNEQVINTSYERFASIRLFSSVNVQLSEADSSMVDCRIMLTPSKLQGVRANLEGSFNSSGLFGVTPSLSYYHKNIFGGGEYFSLGFRGNFQFRFKDPTRSNEFAISSSITFPRFLLLPVSLFQQTLPRTDVNLSYNYQNRPEYTRIIVSTAYGYNWNRNKRSYFQINPLQFNVVRIFNMDDDFYSNLKDPYLINSYRNHFDFGGGGMYYFTTNSATNPKDTYFYLRIHADFAGNMLSLFNGGLKQDEKGSYLIWGVPYSQYFRTEISLVETLRFGRQKRLALAGRLLAGVGYAYGNSNVLPFEKFFYAGGSNSMRGWQSRSVGPGSAPISSSFAIANQTGDMRLEANLELRFPLFWKLQGALFMDAGNVWNLQRASIDGVARDERGIFTSENFFNSIAANWGFGLRLDFDMLLVRLDAGIKAYNPVTQQWHSPDMWLRRGGYAIHFGIGYPF